MQLHVVICPYVAHYLLSLFTQLAPCPPPTPKKGMFNANYFSSSLQLMAEVRSSSSSGVAIAPEVIQLVEYIWEEASGRLGEVLSVPMESVRLEQVEKAEAALLSIRRLLDQGKEGNDNGESVCVWVGVGVGVWGV